MELQIIQSRIYEIRGQRVMLDFDLAELYEIETRRLKESVRRNRERFPAEFMFELTKNEWRELVANCDQFPETIKHASAPPFAFSEYGVVMLASVLRSQKAIRVNIEIVRAFIALRQYALGYDALNSKLELFMKETNMQFSDVYEALAEMASRQENEQPPRQPVGFKLNKQ